MYAPAAARNLSVFFGYDASMMFCHARARKSSLITWQRSASPSAPQLTSARWWKKTATAWKKAPKDA